MPCTITFPGLSAANSSKKNGPTSSPTFPGSVVPRAKSTMIGAQRPSMSSFRVVTTAALEILDSWRDLNAFSSAEIGEDSETLIGLEAAAAD